MELGARFYRDAGLADVEILLNSIGDPACRPAYLARLVAHYRAPRRPAARLERRRLETNPLRLLDSRDPAMAEVNERAPRITDHLCADCAEHFAGVRAHLDAMGVAYRLAPGSCAGWTTTRGRRSSSPPRRGGPAAGARRRRSLRRPDRAAGGKPTPGIGFALGLDRVVLALDATGGGGPRTTLVAVVVGADPADTVGRLRVATGLREAGLPVRADLSVRKLGRQLEAAVREGRSSR